MYQVELNYAKKAAVQAGKMLSSQKEVIVDSAEGKDIKIALDKQSEGKK